MSTSSSTLSSTWGAGVAVLRYWAGARAAAGVAEEPVAAATLQEALDAARAPRDERFARVLSACAFVVDEQPVGRTPHAEVTLAPDAVIEVLPPFAGGAPTASVVSARGVKVALRG